MEVWLIIGGVTSVGQVDHSTIQIMELLVTLAIQTLRVVVSLSQHEVVEGVKKLSREMTVQSYRGK